REPVMKTVFSTGSEPRAGVVSAGKMLLEKTIMDVATIRISAFTPLKYTSRVAFAIPSLHRAVPPAEDGGSYNDRAGV
ncbi:MAG TPA: hypothetical protein VHQ95_19265, partial [Pyrinomonadaceae bacterium]|nr:hypothetical protein [Pyrinomonadaceae bacterium]